MGVKIAEGNADQNDERCHQAGNGPRKRFDEVRKTGFFVARVVVFDGVEIHRDHHRQAEQQARDDAGQKQRAHRDRHRAAPDQHQDAGRNDHAHDR